ncbi:MAG: hypothetical protein ABWK05_08010 [Pyrobaculum sp.]
MHPEQIEKKLIEALIILLLNAKGRVVSIKATSLAKLAGLGADHSAVLKAARLLKKLSHYKIIKTAYENKRNKTYRYVLRADDDLWQITKKDPARAREILTKIISS